MEGFFTRLSRIEFTMTSNIDKVMEAMVASADKQGYGLPPQNSKISEYSADGAAAGSRILAILQRKLTELPHVSVAVPKPALGGPIKDENGNYLIYDREFLFDCAKSVAVQEMPRGLEDKFVEFPHIRRSSPLNFDQLDASDFYDGQSVPSSIMPVESAPGFVAWDWKAGNLAK